MVRGEGFAGRPRAVRLAPESGIVPTHGERQVSRAQSGMIDLDEFLGGESETPVPMQRPDMPELGSQRGAARESLRPQDRTLIEDWFNASTFAAPLPKWYSDFGGSALKATESFASSVGQGLGDLANTLSGGLIDISGTQPVDRTHAQELPESDDPELRLQGERLLEQADYVEGASREGCKLDLQRNRETPYATVDPDSFASTIGRIVGSALAFVALLVVVVILLRVRRWCWTRKTLARAVRIAATALWALFVVELLFPTWWSPYGAGSDVARSLPLVRAFLFAPPSLEWAPELMYSLAFGRWLPKLGAIALLAFAAGRWAAALRRSQSAGEPPRPTSPTVARVGE